MKKKKLKYEMTDYSSYVEGRTRGRLLREYLSWDTITDMLNDFFENCQDVKSQTFEDLKVTYEIREDPTPNDEWGQETILKEMFRLYQVIYQVKSYDDLIIKKNGFNLEEAANGSIKRQLNNLDVYETISTRKDKEEKIEKYWESFKNNEMKFSEFIGKLNEMFGHNFLTWVSIRLHTVE